MGEASWGSWFSPRTCCWWKGQAGSWTHAPFVSLLSSLGCVWSISSLKWWKVFTFSWFVLFCWVRFLPVQWAKFAFQGVKWMQELVKGKGRSPQLAAREGANPVLVKLNCFGKVWQQLLPFACSFKHLLDWVSQERLTESTWFVDVKKVQTSGRCWAAQAIHPVVVQKWILKGFREDVIWGHQEAEHSAVLEISV